MNKLLTKCPSCGENLIITKVSCPNCKLELVGEFENSNELSIENGVLTAEDIAFIKLFLKEEGNLSKIQQIMSIDYYSLKKIINEINIKLGNKENDMCINFVKSIGFKEDNKASNIIKKKLSESGGKAECNMLKGEPLTIWLTNEGVMNSGYQNFVCEWEVFDAIVEKAKELGDIMFRGDSAAQNGAKIGSNELPLNTIDAFISIKFYNGKIGDTTTRRSTYYAAILAWAGICNNYRSKGAGGYIILK